MKNIFIILGMTLAVGFVAMWVTGTLLVQADKKQVEHERVAPVDEPAKSPYEMIKESTEYASHQITLALERDRKSRVAGGIGLGVGLVAGLLIIILRDKRKKG